MQVPLQIAFRGMETSAAVEARLRERAALLEHFADSITSLHVVVQADHKRHHQGNLYQVKLQLRLPGREIVINREGPANHAHEDVYVAIRDAFDALDRRLEDVVRRRDHRGKGHEVPPHGKVVRIYPQESYGFIETSDGLEVYFHKNSVVDGAFGNLKPGDEVRLELAPDESAKGPQASTVHPVGKHHLVE